MESSYKCTFSGIQCTLVRDQKRRAYTTFNFSYLRFENSRKNVEKVEYLGNIVDEGQRKATLFNPPIQSNA